MKKYLSSIWGYVWRPLAYIVGFASILSLVVLPNFNHYKYNLSPFESVQYLALDNFQSTVQYLSFLPQKILQLSLIKIGLDEVAYLRLVSSLIAVSTLVMFFFIVRHWYTSRVALMGTFLFAVSSWFLHQARSAEPDVMYMFASTSLLMCLVLIGEKKYARSMPIVAVLAGLLLYIPGLWLFMIIGSIFARKELRIMWKLNSVKSRFASGLLFVGAIAPLTYGLITNPDNLPRALGWPNEGTISLSIAVDNFTSMWGQIFVSGLNEPLKWLAGTPILDIFTVAMLVLGIYSYVVGLHPVRAKALLVIGILSLIVVTLNGSAALGLLMPVVYLLAASGIGLMLRQWFSVFPKNPLARSLGVGVICFALLIVASYHINRYFIAWPKAYETNKLIIDTE